LVKEIDLERHFAKNKEAMSLSQVPKDSKLATLIAKIRERDAEVKRHAE
jgi:hypothetical protein